MKKKSTKQIGINIKFYASMLITLIISITILFTCLVPRYTKLVTDTTTTGMSTYVNIYSQLIASSLDNMASAMRNSRPILELSNRQSSGQAEEESNDQASGPGNGPGFSGSQALSNIIMEYGDYVRTISYADLNGNIIYSLDESVLNTNISTERYFQNIIAGSSYAMGDTILSDDGTEFIFAFSAINSDDELCGVITARFSSGYLSKILSSSDMELAYSDSGMQLITGENLFDVSGSTIYLSDSKGVVLTASDSNWIGFDTTDNDDTVLNDEENPSSGFIKYEEDGNSYYMAYSHIDEGDWIFVVDIPHTEMFASLNQMKTVIVFLVIIILLLATIMSYLMSNSITRPIKKTTEILGHLSNLELNKINLSDTKRNNDETGVMLTSIETAVEQIKKVITLIESSSSGIYTNALKLSTISNQLQENTIENSQIAEELSAGMDEASYIQARIGQDIITIQDSSVTITDKIQIGVASCDEIITAADVLNHETIQASNVTKEIYHDVKIDVAKALERATAVEKINLMTNSIMDIASQTSLLALNASIEAARAGDAGRGFAIVAEQIGVLAKQSSDTVSNISGIIEEVNAAVNDMTSSLEKTLNFMESQVLNDYSKFIDVSNQYSEKSNYLRKDMFEISNSIQKFLDTLNTMSSSIKETSNSLEISSENMVLLSEKNNQVAAITVDTNQMAHDSTNSAEQLNEILKVFK